MTSYLSENDAENLQNGDVRRAEIAGFGMRYLENHLAHRGQSFFIFTLFYLGFTFFRLEFPFKSKLSKTSSSLMPS